MHTWPEGNRIDLKGIPQVQLPQPPGGAARDDGSVSPTWLLPADAEYGGR